MRKSSGTGTAAAGDADLDGATNLGLLFLRELATQNRRRKHGGGGPFALEFVPDLSAPGWSNAATFVAVNTKVSTDLPPRCRLTAREMYEHLHRVREHRLIETIWFAEDRMGLLPWTKRAMGTREHARLEEKWLPIREHLARWLNIEYRRSEANHRMYTDPSGRWVRRRDRTVRAGLKAAKARAVSDESLAVELRDLARHALRVRDPAHMLWIDLWVDRWARAAAGDTTARQRIERMRLGWASGGWATAKQRRADTEKFKIQPFCQEWLSRVRSGEESPNIIADLSNKTGLSKRYLCRLIKPRKLMREMYPDA